MSRRAKIWLAVAVIVLLGAAGIIFTAKFSPANEKNTVQSETGSKVLKAGDYDIWLTVPDSWEVRDTDNFDFSCTDGIIQLSMFVFDSSYLDDGYTPEDIFGIQNYRLLENRDNVEAIDAGESVENGKHIISEFYTAQREDYEKNQYNTYLMEFDDSELFMWVCVNGLPEDIDAEQMQIDSILRSVTTEN